MATSTDPEYYNTTYVYDDDDENEVREEDGANDAEASRTENKPNVTNSEGDATSIYDEDLYSLPHGANNDSSTSTPQQENISKSVAKEKNPEREGGRCKCSKTCLAITGTFVGIVAAAMVATYFALNSEEITDESKLTYNI